ncbi:glycosyltransferase [Pseudomonas fulva]|uniref:glycosyltransferase n=1 Tax=Pseudomonas fulva TaxID=47880 RepID=UPI001E2FA968|nr:glycosyltransferase [Pseudomonas fulva]
MVPTDPTVATASTPARVAVLLAAYEGRAWIEAQMASVLAQVGVRVDVYISVDPSNDGTQEWCATFASANPNVILLPSAGRFGGAARNFFRLIRDVDVSAYDYVAFCDQDDVWYPDKLERAVAVLQYGPAAGYSSNVVAFWEDGRRVLVQKAQPQRQWDYLFEAAGPGCTYVLNKALITAFKSLVVARWDQVQHIDLHDWFCYAFARSRGYAWFIDPAPSLDYRQHERNQVGVNSGIASAVARWRKIVDGWWFSQAQRTVSVLGIENPFIDRQGKMAWLKLAMHVSACRRRTRDRAVMFFACLVNAASARR